MRTDAQLFLAAVALTVAVAASVDALVHAVPARQERSALRAYPGAAAGAMFMLAMAASGVAPSRTAYAFLLPWAAAHAAAAEWYGVATARERVKRHSLAAAAGGVGVLAALGP